MPRHNARLNHQRDLEHQARVDQAIRDATGADTQTTTLPADPADARQLRGIPAIGGRGTLGGHIPGTRPDHLDLIQTDRRRL